MGIKFEELKADMPHKWKVQTASDYNCMCVAYVDSRQVQDKLDDVVGPANWQDRYATINGQLYCEVGIYDEDKQEWVWKGDCGTESMTEKEKGQSSDAFKRAAVKWGVGRFLYAKDIQKVKSMKNNRGKNVPCDDNGKQIWDLTKHINQKLGTTAKSYAKPKAKAPEPASATGDTYTQAGRPERYNADKANGSYKTHTLSAETMESIRNLNRDGKTGGEVLKSYLPKYNEANDTSLSASDLKTDDIVTAVLTFIDNTAPTNV